MRQAVVWTLTAAVAGESVFAQYAPILQYQRRGDRDEGLRTVAIGGTGIALVSARVDPPQPARRGAASWAWAADVKARFYLPDATPVYLIVRQLRSLSTYYWLTLPTQADSSGARQWTPATTNEYVWPTSAVLSRLRDVELDNLGAVVRVGQPDATNMQRVLPVALYDREPIEAVGSYRFSFRPLRRVNITATIYRESSELFVRASKWEDADSPFTIVWDPGTTPEGWHRLALKGFFDNNQQVNQEVTFYHKRALQGAVRRDAK